MSLLLISSSIQRANLFAPNTPSQITASDVTSRSVEAFFCSFVNSKGDWTTVEEGNRPLLREVLFHNNCIGPKGASAIAAFLGSSLGVAVETIGLSRNPILEGGLAHLLYSLSLQKKAIERKRAKSQGNEQRKDNEKRDSENKN